MGTETIDLGSFYWQIENSRDKKIIPNMGTETFSLSFNGSIDFK